MPGRSVSVGVQAQRQPPHLAAAIGALASDQVARRRVDRDNSVQPAQDRVLRLPEPHGEGDRPHQRGLRVGQHDRSAQLDQRRVGVERLADRIHQVDPRPEVLVDGRAGHTGAFRHLLHGRFVEPLLAQQLPHRRHDPLARVLRPGGAAAAAI